MAKGILRYCFPAFLAYLLIASCAKPGSPTGGPKDKEPPVILKSEPLNGQTNFRGKKIVITFNEYVALDKITEKFMVSPPLARKPVISVKGKSVIIDYDEELKDSTTYTFYFQDAIRDLNESNPIDNYQFVISTGNVLDSLSVTGNVLSAFSLDPPENTLALLYRNHADSALMKSLPDYITKVTKTGYFRIDNVREGIYRLYALKDIDNSKNFNLADEQIAFLDTLIEVTAGGNYIPPVPDTLKAKPVASKVNDTIVLKGDYRLILFAHEKKIRYLTSSPRSSQYRMTYTLSLPPDSIGFDLSIPGAGPDSYYIEKSREGDTIQVWMTDSSLYSQSQITTVIGYPFTDSLGNIIRKQDTVLMRYLAPRAPRGGRTRPVPYKVTSGFSTGALRPGQKIIFSSMTPFREPDTSRIKIYEMKDKEKIIVPYLFEKDSANSCRMILKADLKQKKNYIFIADSGAFGSIYGEHSDSTGNRFTVRSDETFSKIVLNINNFEGNRIIQLLNDQEKVLREVQMDRDGKTEFSLLDKGRYRIRVIYDLNGDGKWTTGDFISRRQPEPVSFFPKVLDLPENFWDIEDWDIREQNFKKFKITSGTGQKKLPGRL